VDAYQARMILVNYDENATLDKKEDEGKHILEAKVGLNYRR
jgi:hypothetical protein